VDCVERKTHRVVGLGLDDALIGPIDWLGHVPQEGDVYGRLGGRDADGFAGAIIAYLAGLALQPGRRASGLAVAVRVVVLESRVAGASGKAGSDLTVRVRAAAQVGSRAIGLAAAVRVIILVAGIAQALMAAALLDACRAVNFDTRVGIAGNRTLRQAVQPVGFEACGALVTPGSGVTRPAIAGGLSVEVMAVAMGARIGVAGGVAHAEQPRGMVTGSATIAQLTGVAALADTACGRGDYRADTMHTGEIVTC